MRTMNRETAFQLALLKEVGEGVSQYSSDFEVEESHLINTLFAEVFCFSQGAVISMKDFSAFLRYEEKQELGF